MPRNPGPSPRRMPSSASAGKRRTPVVLLTGFEPFGGERSNPSWDAVRQLRGARIAGHRIAAVRLPVTFADSLPALRRALREHRPALTLCVGQAGGRARISLERVAVNLIDARIADNRGAQPIDAAVVADGPAAYFSTLPVKAMRAALQEGGWPVELSHSAGTYVCNQVFYGLMHALRHSHRARGGFIHIPYAPEQVVSRPDAPCMPIDTVVAALRIAIGVALRTSEDLPIAGGETH